MEKGHAHSPAMQGMCLQCHKPHVSQKKKLLVADKSALCSNCHDLASEGFTKAHLNRTGEGLDCTS
ncbi:MAG: cytochrome C, partial [Anaerolineae bacterium]|nr:cytochrome C [Anaerolineae bacterium]